MEILKWRAGEMAQWALAVQFWRPEFSPQNTHARTGRLNPESCLQTFRVVLWYLHKQYTQTSHTYTHTHIKHHPPTRFKDKIWDDGRSKNMEEVELDKHRNMENHQSLVEQKLLTRKIHQEKGKWNPRISGSSDLLIGK